MKGSYILEEVSVILVISALFSFSNPRAVVVSYISVRGIDACLSNCMFDIGLCVCVAKVS